MVVVDGWNRTASERQVVFLGDCFYVWRFSFSFLGKKIYFTVMLNFYIFSIDWIFFCGWKFYDELLFFILPTAIFVVKFFDLA